MIANRGRSAYIFILSSAGAREYILNNKLTNKSKCASVQGYTIAYVCTPCNIMRRGGQEGIATGVDRHNFRLLSNCQGVLLHHKEGLLQVDSYNADMF